MINLRRLAIVGSAALIALYVAYFVRAHHLPAGTGWHPLISDFLAIWSAGRLAHEGNAAAAYSPHLIHAAEEAILGRHFTGRYDWPYPPFYFFVIAPLASLGYLRAFIVWVAITMAGYAMTVGAVARSRLAVLLALAAPWSFVNLSIGQNGSLTAMLFGLVLLSLESRPVLAGLLLGFLAYKPQFGLLFPVALAAAGCWRTIASASLTVIVLMASSLAAFGKDAFAGFLHQMTITSQTLLVEGLTGWSKLQSLYAFLRWLHAPAIAAWTVQAILTITCAVAVAALWRSRTSNNVKAAGLCAAALLATPYVFVYDLPLLAVAAAFLHRDRALDRFDLALLGIAILEIAAKILSPLPAGLFATLLVTMMVLRRAGPSIFAGARRERPGPSRSPSSMTAGP